MRKCVYEIDVSYKKRKECAGSARYSKFVVQPDAADVSGSPSVDWHVLTFHSLTGITHYISLNHIPSPGENIQMPFYASSKPEGSPSLFLRTSANQCTENCK